MATILIVDDETGVRSLLRRILEEEGHQVIEAGNGRKAVELYRLIPTDLVILDILMPIEDGMETTWQLNREFPGVKIIAMTGGQGEENFLDAAKILGAHRTIAKPFEVEDLLHAVREELAGRC
jgi:DNA-binding NtrC family response regulator